MASLSSSSSPSSSSFAAAASASTSGSGLGGLNEELLACLQGLRERRSEVHREILRAEEERQRVQREVAELNDRLAKLNGVLATKLQARAEYDRTIQETEAAYSKILESSQTLLHVLRREATHLGARATTTAAKGGAAVTGGGNGNGSQCA